MKKHIQKTIDELIELNRVKQPDDEKISEIADRVIHEWWQSEHHEDYDTENDAVIDSRRREIENAIAERVQALHAAKRAGVIDINPHQNGDVYENIDYQDTRYIGRIQYDGMFSPADDCQWNDDDVAEKLQRLILDPPKEVSWPHNQRVFAARYPSPEIIARYLWDEQHLSPNTTIHVWLTSAGFTATIDSWEYRDEDIVHLATISFGDNVPLNREELEESLIEATI